MKDLLSPSTPAVEDLFPRTVIQPVSILLTAGFLLAAGPACADGAFRTGLEVAASNGFKALRGRKVTLVPPVLMVPTALMPRYPQVTAVNSTQ